MKNTLILLIVGFILVGCDTPDTPDYSILVKTGSNEYAFGDSILVLIQNKTRQSIYIRYADSLATTPDFFLEQKTTTNWRQSGTMITTPATYLRKVDADSTVSYRFSLPFAAVPTGGVNIFRVNHEVFLENNFTRHAGEQMTASNPFFILE